MSETMMIVFFLPLLPSLSFMDHNVHVIRIDGICIDWWLRITWISPLHPCVKNRWFPSSNNLNNPTVSPLISPVDKTKPRPLSPANQRRGGCSVFTGKTNVAAATAWVWETFSHQIWEICGEDCWWRPGRRDRRTSCLSVTMKASWRRGRSKIR